MVLQRLRESPKRNLQKDIAEPPQYFLLGIDNMSTTSTTGRNGGFRYHNPLTLRKTSSGAGWTASNGPRVLGDLKLAIWNVRSLYQSGNVVLEMKRLVIVILGISKCRWSGSNTIKKGGYHQIYAGGEMHYERGWSV